MCSNNYCYWLMQPNFIFSLYNLKQQHTNIKSIFNNVLLNFNVFINKHRHIFYKPLIPQRFSLLKSFIWKKEYSIFILSSINASNVHFTLVAKSKSRAQRTAGIYQCVWISRGWLLITNPKVWTLVDDHVEIICPLVGLCQNKYCINFTTVYNLKVLSQALD